jgi:hypothetical protein
MNQNEIDKLFYDAVTSVGLRTVKYYLLESTPKANIFYNNNDALMYAAGTNQVGFLDFFLTSPELFAHSDDEHLSPCIFSSKVECDGNHNGLGCIRIAAQAKEKALVTACQYGCFPAIRYLLTCERFSTPTDIHYNGDEALATACKGSQIEIAKYLLTHKKLKQRADIHGGGNRALRWAFRSSLPNKHVVEFLLTNPKLEKHANIYDDDCAPFFELVNNPSSVSKEDVWHYLVFDYKIEIRPAIEKFMKQSPDHIGARLLFRRELHDGLCRDLATNNVHKAYTKV